MTERALLTANEREVLAGNRGDEEYRSTVRTRLRRRLEELEVDVEVLSDHEPELLEWVRNVVCEDSSEAAT